MPSPAEVEDPMFDDPPSEGETHSGKDNRLPEALGKQIGKTKNKIGKTKKQLGKTTHEIGKRTNQLVGKQLIKFDKGTLLPKLFASTTRIVTEPLMVFAWDVAIPPFKKRVLAGNVVPAPFRAVVGHVGGVQRRRRLQLEIHGPPEDIKEESLTRLTLQDEHNGDGSTLDENSDDFLADHDVVLVRVYATSPEEQEDDMVELVTYRIEDFQILNLSGSTLEVRIGGGGETVIRDILFNSKNECQRFGTIVRNIQRLEEERCQRQMAVYMQSRGESDDVENHDHDINLLVEIVSATGLPAADMFSSLNAYIVVKMNGKEIHRTSAIANTVDPIWTLEKGALFLFRRSPEEFFSCTGGMSFIVNDYNTFMGYNNLGRVHVGLDDLLKADGERTEHEIKLAKGVKPPGENKKSLLYLRVKQADEDDIEFMKAYQDYKGLVGVYADETYAAPGRPTLDLLKRKSKKRNKESEEKELLRRVKPYPDPARPETTWLSDERIEEESLKHSTNWMEAGSGDLGRLYLEVLGCDGLPNMDMIRTINLLDKTHCFVCLVHEDSVVNTDVIQDCLSPRFMPWSRRAFCFNIFHPQSNLFIGVYDFDMEQSPVQIALRVVKTQHNAIGRCVVNLSNFLPETVYTVTYPFYYGELEHQRKKPRGAIKLRLRIEWASQRSAVLSTSKPPPPIVVSCARRIDWQVAHYTVNGIYDDTKYDMKTFARYITELQDYEKVVPYLEEFLYTIWLWRGHYPLTVCGKSVVHLPLHSMTAFAWGLLICYDFNMFPGFLVFCIGWSFLASNEIVCMTPSPWHRRRGYLQLWLVMLRGSLFTESIEPDQNLEEIRDFDKTEDQRQKRWHKTKELKSAFAESMKKEFSNEMDPTMNRGGIEDIATKAEGAMDSLNVRPLKPVLYPIQLRLRKVVLRFRTASSVFLWVHTYYAFWITTLSFVGCFAVVWIPWGVILRRLLRVVIVVMLGPWMAIVDRCFLQHKIKMTDEEHEAEVHRKLKKRYEKVLHDITDYQVKKERAAKLKSMKKYLYGKFMVGIPRINLDISPDFPLPRSHATVYDRKTAEPINVTGRKFGQHLQGDMIPTREIQATSDTSSPHRDRRGVVRRMVNKLRNPAGEKTPLLDHVK